MAATPDQQELHSLLTAVIQMQAWQGELLDRVAMVLKLPAGHKDTTKAAAKVAGRQKRGRTKG